MTFDLILNFSLCNRKLHDKDVTALLQHLNLSDHPHTFISETTLDNMKQTIITISEFERNPYEPSSNEMKPILDNLGITCSFNAESYEKDEISDDLSDISDT